MGPLTVTFLDHSARPSGAEIALLRLCDALLQTGEVLPRVVLGEDGPLVDRLTALDVPTEVFPLAPVVGMWRRSSRPLDRFAALSAASLFPYAVRLAARLREIDCNVLHSYSLKSNLYGAIAARRASLPQVWQANDRVTAAYFARTAVAPIRLATRWLPTTVVANSGSTLRSTGARGHVICPPLPDGLLERAPVQHRAVTDDLVVGMVGRLSPWKGQDIFLQAFARAFRDTRVRGLIVGGALFDEVAWEREMHRLSGRLGLDRQVQFVGHLDDVEEAMRRIDVLVHCSTIPEPFGQVVAEGMALGLCIVAANEGGPAEIVRNGETGVLTPVGDVGELAAALGRLARDPMTRRRLGAAARTAAREFAPARIAADHVRVYRELVPGRS
jgi:glycosyltransferase involved in cell wall biosynthesis